MRGRRLLIGIELVSRSHHPILIEHGLRGADSVVVLNSFVYCIVRPDTLASAYIYMFSTEAMNCIMS
jgi:hypothetical protein